MMWPNDFQKEGSEEITKLIDMLIELRAHLNDGTNTVDGQLYYTTVEKLKKGAENLEEIAEANS